MTKQKNNRNSELDAFFESAKRSTPIASATLRDRILQDVQQELQEPKTYVPEQHQSVWWRNLFNEIGGFPSVVRYGTVAILGLFIGLSASNWSNLVLQFDNSITVEEIKFADPFAESNLLYADLSLLYLED
tara:strand:- start:694 stop:1086 length:393 start_codon:yes stop_codon:yes gene_type:complete